MSDSVTLWTVTVRVHLSMGLPRWGAMPSSRGIFSTQRWNPCLSSALAGGFFTTSATWEALNELQVMIILRTSNFFSPLSFVIFKQTSNLEE